MDSKVTAAQERKINHNIKIEILKNKIVENKKLGKWSFLSYASKATEKEKDKKQEYLKTVEKLENKIKELEELIEKDKAILESKPRIFILDDKIFSIRVRQRKITNESKVKVQKLQTVDFFPKAPTNIPGQ